MNSIMRKERCPDRLMHELLQRGDVALRAQFEHKYDPGVMKGLLEIGAVGPFLGANTMWLPDMPRDYPNRIMKINMDMWDTINPRMQAMLHPYVASCVRLHVFRLSAEILSLLSPLSSPTLHSPLPPERSSTAAPSPHSTTPAPHYTLSPHALRPLPIFPIFLPVSWYSIPYLSPSPTCHLPVPPPLLPFTHLLSRSPSTAVFPCHDTFPPNCVQVRLGLCRGDAPFQHLCLPPRSDPCV